MSALSKLIAVETKLFLREPVSLFFVFALPIGLMLVFGLPQRAGTAADTGQHAEQTFLPSLALALTIGMLALFTLPMALGIYRERRILRRLATAPVQPALLLVAQVVVNLVMGVLGAWSPRSPCGSCWTSRRRPTCPGSCWPSSSGSRACSPSAC